MSNADQNIGAFDRQWREHQGVSEAERELRNAEIKANAKAARLLAARECPKELIDWAQLHNLPTFAEWTWQAGFLAGMRAAELLLADVGLAEDEKFPTL